MISRLLQLRSYIPAIESHSDYKSSHLPINFQLIDAAKECLFIPYLLEQILQRGSSNGIHFAYCWLQLQSHLTTCYTKLQSTGNSTAASELDQAWQKRDKMMRSCGIFDLLCALWPYPKLSIQAKHRAKPSN